MNGCLGLGFSSRCAKAAEMFGWLLVGWLLVDAMQRVVVAGLSPV